MLRRLVPVLLLAGFLMNVRPGRVEAQNQDPGPIGSLAPLLKQLGDQLAQRRQVEQQQLLQQQQQQDAHEERESGEPDAPSEMRVEVGSTDLFHQARMYYEDRLAGAGFARAFLTGAAGAGPHHADDVEQIRRTLQDRLKTVIETVDPRAAAGLTDRISAGPALLEALTPLVGLLLRGRKAA